MTSFQTSSQALHIALNVILDNIDYTTNACSPTELVGAVLPPDAITRARESIELATAAIRTEDKAEEARHTAALDMQQEMDKIQSDWQAMALGITNRVAALDAKFQEFIKSSGE